MAFNLEAFLGGVAEHGIDYMREEKEEQRRKQRAEDDFGITKRGIDYRLDAQDKLTKREKRKAAEEFAVEGARVLQGFGYSPEVITDILTSKASYADAIKIGEKNRQTGTFDSPDVVWSKLNKSNNINVKAGEVSQEAYNINGEKYRQLFKPVEKGFKDLNAMLVHQVNLSNNATTTIEKAKHDNDVQETLMNIRREAEAKNVDGNKDIMSSSGAQSTINWFLGQARNNIGKKVDINQRIENKIAGEEGKEIAAELQAVARARIAYGDTSENLNKLVNSVEQGANKALIAYGRNVVKLKESRGADEDLLVKNHYKLENSWSDVSKKMATNQYKVGDVIQYYVKGAMAEKGPANSYLRTIIYTGVPLTYTGGQVRSYIIGR